VTSARAAAGAPRIEPYGEAAFLVSLADAVSVAVARRAQILAARVAALAAAEEGWEPPVQGVASVLATFDPLRVEPSDAEARLAQAMALLPDDPGPAPDARVHEIAVRYGGEHGPDLEGVAALVGLTAAQVIERHAAEAVEVLALGFAPGFAYLGLTDPAIGVPRHATPRGRVAAGSVALADRMTAIYPASSPAGWQVIGRADVPLFDPAREPPALFRPGDLVRFRPVRR
jgi:inhibitor of KinA